MIKYKDKEIAGYKDVDADTVVVLYADNKQEVVKREDLVDDGQMLKGPGDQMPKVTRTIPGKEINIHIPDRDVEVVLTKEQKDEAVKAEKAAKDKADKAKADKPKAPWL
jgi:hypothetical protein